MGRVEYNRLRWKCRRGLLELDLIFENFFNSDVNNQDLEALNQLLDLQDNDLLDIVSGRSEDFDPRHRGIVARLRAVTAAPIGRAC
jgi:succinate dehydrogenase flavin-adding protein (antitoxin of CptAB toxin-antitoxin module)